MIYAGNPGRNWDWHPDGDRMVMVDPPQNDAGEDGEPEVPRIYIILNWTQELLERVAVD